jgi:hypothetical protein
MPTGNPHPARLAIAPAELPVGKLTFHRSLTVKELLEYQLISLLPSLYGLPSFIEIWNIFYLIDIIRFIVRDGRVQKTHESWLAACKTTILNLK